MKPREQHTPDGGNGPSNVPSAPPASSSDGCLTPSAWESLFAGASPVRREELLALARARGILYAHQLPDVVATGGTPRTFSAATLLNDRARELPAARPSAISPEDTALDAEQREAVARAVHTPDICLIAGVAGSGKSRVVTEILTRAAARGQRVLFLAPDSVALDHVLTALARSDKVCPVRCLAPDETADRLPAAVRCLTLEARVRHFREHTVAGARAAADAARLQVERERDQAGKRERLRSLANSGTALAARIASLEARAAALAQEVAGEFQAAPDPASPFAAELTDSVRAREAAVACLEARESSLRAERAKVQAAHEEVRTDEAKLVPLEQARRGYRIWSSAWWRAWNHGNIQARLEQVRARRSELELEAARRQEEAAALDHERAEMESTYQATLERLRAAEVARRSVGIEEERARAVAEQAQFTAEWLDAVALLDPAAPAEFSTTDVAELCAAGNRRLAEALQSLAAAERWRAAVEESLPDIARQLAATCDVVAASLAAIAADPHFGERAAPFDLLVLEEADRITETEFLRAARRACRWVLIGEVVCDPEAPDGSRRANALRPGFFQRLWERFHANPSRLSRSWFRQQDGRLCCQLRPLSADERSRLEVERVADRPEIELRILTPPRSTPQLAEVVFPPDYNAARAKAYLFNELDELPVQSRGRSLRWSEEPDRWILWLEPTDTSRLESIAIAPGVSELLGFPQTLNSADEPPFLTHALAFDRLSGWTRERAEDWAAHHAGIRDSGRTAFLGQRHRMRPALARLVAGVLAAGHSGEPQAPACEGEPAVEFVPVPALPADANLLRRGESDSRRRGGGTATAARHRATKGGAGLETELADSPRPDTLPFELRRALPAKGLVNYLEARAVVAELEALAADGDFRVEAERWQQSDCGRHGHGPTIAVIALYAAQAELIRELIARAPALSACPYTVEVGTPNQFRQRECLVALLSLTRSHAHRPVSFGEGPQALALALTRPRARLLLFGDFGTLVRRCQGAGPIDHLDHDAAAREQAAIAQLVACIQGQGDWSGAFRLRQGTGT